MQFRRKFRSRPRARVVERRVYLIDGVAVPERVWRLGLEAHAVYDVEEVMKK